MAALLGPDMAAKLPPKSRPRVPMASCEAHRSVIGRQFGPWWHKGGPERYFRAPGRVTNIVGADLATENGVHLNHLDGFEGLAGCDEWFEGWKVINGEDGCLYVRVWSVVQPSKLLKLQFPMSTDPVN